MELPHFPCYFSAVRKLKTYLSLWRFRVTPTSLSILRDHVSLPSVGKYRKVDEARKDLPLSLWSKFLSWNRSILNSDHIYLHQSGRFFSSSICFCIRTNCNFSPFLISDSTLFFRKGKTKCRNITENFIFYLFFYFLGAIGNFISIGRNGFPSNGNLNVI